ncbi:MAG: hypothetical protein FRX49_09564 [Trebouxia sp. A1-2]|nr:MAG: hypothetical protein FRX49_09564 [Trebouxia sp. A1-2]
MPVQTPAITRGGVTQALRSLRSFPVKCNCDSETEPKDASEVIDLTAPRLDITQDLPTLQHLKDYSFPPTASEQEKMRIRNKSVRYEYREIFGPSATVLDKALENITYAQNKQMTDYAKRQLDGKAPENKSTSDAKHFSADKHCLASKPMKTAVNELCQPKSVANADANNATAPLPAPKTPLVTVKANTNDIPSSSKSVLLPPVSETLPSAPDSVAPTVTIKQETPAQPELRKRPHLPTFDIDDFVVMKVHKTARKEGDRKGKLVPKAEGPYLVQRFTDNTRRMAILADANGLTWTRRTAELSKWELD